MMWQNMSSHGCYPAIADMHCGAVQVVYFKRNRQSAIYARDLPHSAVPETYGFGQYGQSECQSTKARCYFNSFGFRISTRT
jgi:hypothetical protein